MRIFIGIRVDEKTRQKLECMARELADGFRAWRPTEPANYHITIKFIGETDISTLEIIKNCVKRAASGIVKLKACTMGSGSFRRNNKQTIFYAVEKTAGLEKLYQRVCSELKANGMHCEEQKFIPHITIAREVDVKDGFSFPVQKDIDLAVDSISVMESTRLNGKLIYIPKLTIVLEDEDNGR